MSYYLLVITYTLLATLKIPFYSLKYIYVMLDYLNHYDYYQLCKYFCLSEYVPCTSHDIMQQFRLSFQQLSITYMYTLLHCQMSNESRLACITYYLCFYNNYPSLAMLFYTIFDMIIMHVKPMWAFFRPLDDTMCNTFFSKFQGFYYPASKVLFRIHYQCKLTEIEFALDNLISTGTTN